MNLICSSDISKILNFNLNKHTNYSAILADVVSNSDRERLERRGIRELTIDGLSEDERIKCEREYIENISKLSSRYHSLEWWANPLSEKNEHISLLYRNLCTYYKLVMTLKNHVTADKTVFILCSLDIYKQLRKNNGFKHIRIQSLDHAFSVFIKEIRKYLSDFFKIIFFLIKVIIKKTYTSCRLGFVTGKRLEKRSNYYIIRTWLDDRFLSHGWTCRDAYFGRLPEYVSKRGYDVLVLASILNNYFKIIDKIKRTEKVLIVPEEYFFAYSDLFRLFVHSHFKKLKIKEKLLFNGFEATNIYNMEIKRGKHSVGFRSNIIRYFMAERLANTVNFKNYIHTFENYAWEKMYILGLRSGTANGRILGFQHAYISRNSFKYFPGTGEKNIMPLPDRIISLGRKTLEIMQKYGSYNSVELRVGCALRQEYLSNIEPLRRHRFNNIVVPLTMVKSESLTVLKFLNDSKIAETGIKVVIRCHPAAPFDSFMEDLDFDMPDSFSISREANIKDELAHTDMVLYTWTTVAVEAIKMGIPVIYLDVLEPMYIDPLFECSALKKSVGSPDELLPVIEGIYSMDDESFYNEQEKSQKYLKDYFYPVTDENVQSSFF